MKLLGNAECFSEILTKPRRFAYVFLNHSLVQHCNAAFAFPDFLKVYKTRLKHRLLGAREETDLSFIYALVFLLRGFLY